MKKKNSIRLFMSIAAVIIMFFALGCNQTEEEVQAVITAELSNITQTTAVSGGRIRDFDTAKFVIMGVCWSTGEKPTLADHSTADTTTTGTFTSYITGLHPNTEYHVRAYIIENNETEYGRAISFTTENYGTVTDIDGNVYSTLSIGSQIWMAENLKVTHYRNGDPITNITDESKWSSHITGAYCYYDNSSNNQKTYGNLYNWYAVNDNRNIAPTGWHIPTDAELTTLIDYLIRYGYGYQGSGSDICKSLASQSGWTVSTTEGATGFEQLTNNSSGFAALPGGCRDPQGVFTFVEGYGFWWTTSPLDANEAMYLCLYSHYYDVFRASCSKNYGFSVRCIKN